MRGFLQAHIAAAPPAQSPGSSTCLQLPFASVRLGLDFARYACHNIGQHHLAAGQCPAHNLAVHLTARSSRLVTAALARKLR